MKPPSSEVTWTVLGSSSGIPSPDRNCSGHLLEIGERLTLFDCGSGITSAFLKYGFDPDRLENIFISHTHSDHISDLPLLVQLLYNLKRMNPLTIYLPAEAVAPIESLLQTCYLFREKFSFELRIEPLQEDRELSCGGFEVRAILNTHLLKSAPLISEHGYKNKMQCYSFLIKISNGKKILYSADIGSLDDIIAFLEGLDLLILEGFHIDLAALYKYLSRNEVNRVILTHLPDGGRLSILKQISDSPYRNILQTAEDGLSIIL